MDDNTPDMTGSPDAGASDPTGISTTPDVTQGPQVGGAIPQGATVGSPIPQGASVGKPQVGGAIPQGASVGSAIPQGATVGTPESQEQPGLLSRTYENTPIPGIVDLVNKQIDYKPRRRPMDLYHEAVQRAQAGDWTGAAENAASIVSGGLLAKDNPIFKAAEEIIMHPINEIKEQYKEARKAGANPVAATTSGPALVQGLKDTTQRIATDRAAGNPVAAYADSATALMQSHAVGAIPLVGSAIQQVGADLDEDLHNKNYSAAIGDILGPLLTLGAGKILGNLKDVSAESKVKPNKLTRAAQTVKEANEAAQQALTKVQLNEKLANALDIGTSYARETAQNDLDLAGNRIKATGDNAPDNSLITDNASDMVKNARKDLSTNYTTGISQLRDMAQGETVDYEGSPWHQSVLDSLEQGTAEGTPVDEAIGKSRPGSPRVNSMLEKLSDLNKEPEAPTEPLSGPGAGSILNEFIRNGEETGGFSLPEGSEGTTPEPTQLTLDDLVKARQTLGERLRKLGHDSDDIADTDIYHNMIQGIDDTIEQLVNKVGQPVEGAEPGTPEAEGDPELAAQARQILDQTNAAYKEGIRRFGNTDVKSLQKGNVNDVAARLMRGETSLDDINAVKQTIGEQNFQRLGHDSLKRIVADSIDESGNMDYGKFLRTWSKIKAPVRIAMFGPDLATDLTDNLNTATRATAKLGEVNKLVSDLLGNPNDDVATTLLKDHARVDALSQTIGPEAMRDLGKSILQRKIAEASGIMDNGTYVKTHFNPDVMIDWWKEVSDNPEIQQKLFTIDEAGAAKYNKMMKDFANVSSVKTLVKYGLLPTIFGGAGIVYGGLASLVAAMIGGVADSFGRVRTLLDTVANRPGTWKALGYVGQKIDTLRAAGRVATGTAKSTAVKVGTATKNTAPIIHRPLHDVLKSTQSSLGKKDESNK